MGGSMFTIGDIRNIAVQIEKNGEESYRRAAAIAKDPEVTEILLWMAEQEKRHANWFKELKSNKPLTQEQKEMEEIGKTLLQDMVKGNDFLLDQQGLESAETIKEVLEISKNFEKDTILFYEFLLGFLDDEETSSQLKKIIEEERSHIDQIEQMEKSNNRVCNGISC